MDLPSDSSGMEAMVHADIQAESLHVDAKLSNECHPTLEDLLFRPTTSQDVMDVSNRVKSRPFRGSRISEADLKGKAYDDVISYSQKSLKPIKTI